MKKLSYLYVNIDATTMKELAFFRLTFSICIREKVRHVYTSCAYLT